MNSQELIVTHISRVACCSLHIDQKHFISGRNTVAQGVGARKTVNRVACGRACINPVGNGVCIGSGTRGVGVHVKVNGADGVISNYNWKWIFIRRKGGDEMLVPMEKWQTLTWIIKDYYKDIYKEEENEQS